MSISRNVRGKAFIDQNYPHHFYTRAFPSIHGQMSELNTSRLVPKIKGIEIGFAFNFLA